MSERQFARCSDCGRRVMLPRWLDPEVVLQLQTRTGDVGDLWYCMDCSGETSRERVEWAEDYAADVAAGTLALDLRTPR